MLPLCNTTFGSSILRNVHDIHALTLQCYKVILDCSSDNVQFYKRCGFTEKEVQMVVYFPANDSLRPRL